MVLRIEGLDKAKIIVGEIVEEEEWEPLGPTPFPGIRDLRSWDHLLLSRYKPFYSPFCDFCCLCVDGDSMITLGDGQTKTIRELVEEHLPDGECVGEVKDNIRVQSFDLNDKKIKKLRVLRVFKHAYSGRMLHIRTRSGRILRLTPNHRVLVSRQELEWARADELVIGDEIVVANKFSTPQKPPHTIDHLSDEMRVYDQQFITWCKSKILERWGSIRSAALSVGEKVCGSRWRFADIFYRNGAGRKIKLKEAKILVREVGEEWESVKVKIGKVGMKRGITFPKFLTPQLMYFIGLLASDGYSTNTLFGISNTNLHLMRQARKIYLSLFKREGFFRTLRQKGNEIVGVGKVRGGTIYRLEDRNSVLCGILKSFGSEYRNLSRLPTKLIASFLAGYFDGDGSVSRTPTGFSISLFSSNPAVARQIQHLLSTLGIASIIRQTRKEPPLYAVEVRGYTAQYRFATRINSMHPRKKEMLNTLVCQYLNTKARGRIPTNWTECLPVSVGRELKKIMDAESIPKSRIGIHPDAVRRWLNGGHPSRGKMKTVVRALKRQVPEKVLGSLEEWLTAPIVLDRVVEIKSSDVNGYVYNLEVEKTHNYVTNGIVVQNCTYGKCDLTHKHGACGIDIAAQQARIVLLACCMGTAAHLGHARHLLDHIINRFGEDVQIDLGPEIEVEAPITRTVTGIRPRKIGDFKRVLEYCSEQLSHCLSATHVGMESSYLDFESKSLHIGMIDNLAKEVADISQIVAYGFPKGDADAPLVEIGLASVDASRPVTLSIGHNPPSAFAIVDYLRRSGISGVEVCGLCCTAHEIGRYEHGAKIIGSIGKQLYFIRSGVPDVVILDEQCVRTDLLAETKNLGIPLILTSDKIMGGVKDRTDDDPSAIIEDMISGREHAVFIGDPLKVGEVAAKVAIAHAPAKKLPKLSREQIIEWANKCTYCRKCIRACPVHLEIPSAMRDAAEGKLAKLAELYEICVGCGRCEHACKQKIPIMELIRCSATRFVRSKVRAGRGPIKDTEIRKVGRPIVFGEIPGVVAYVGCANYPRGGKEIAEMAEEFLKRRYIVVASGCSAMDIAMYLDEEGKSIYEKYPGDFDSGCIANVGSCVANAHIVGAAIKIASIFARRRLRANFEEIADYILTRVGACGVAWGAMSQKAASIATGFNRWGIPVILGPQGSKYRRLYLGRRDDDERWWVYDAKSGEKVYSGPCPEHLICAAETKEEAIVMTAKLCMRPSDTTMGRQTKLTNYIDLHEKYFGTLPDDWYLYVRTKAELPITRKKELSEILDKIGWIPRKIPDPTLLERFRTGWK